MARVKPLNKITLRDMMLNMPIYFGLAEGLSRMPVPEKIKIGMRRFPVPATMEALAGSICYGQRLFMVRKEDNDFGLMLRIMDGYFYPLFTKKKWDEDKALLFGKKLLSCNVVNLYPTSMHLTSLVSEMIEREQTLLHREPSKIELAAGIEKLNTFAELNSLDFLRDVMKCTIPEVLLTPYNECLVRFMIAKETAEYQERYMELLRETNETKSKYK